jgi:hypothetical protein
MSNVVSINRGMVFGSYTDIQNGERIPEDVSFAVGVISTIALPQLCLYTVYGVFPSLVFAVITLAGVMWGEARYNRSAEKSIPQVITGAVPRTPRSEAVKLKDAA